MTLQEGKLPKNNMPEALKRFIFDHEKLRLKAYMPTKNDRPTIGVGNTYYTGALVKKFGRKDVRLGDVITEQEAYELFDNVLDSVKRDVASLVTAPITDNQFGALVSFAYNVGSDIDADDIPEGLGDSKLLKIINKNPNDRAIYDEWKRWNKQKGIVLNGLVTRRAHELNYYFKQ